MSKKKLLSVLMLILLLITSTSITAFANDVIQHVDVVLVIDDTNSMKSNDTEKIAAQAVKKFTDRLASSGDQIGIVTYSIQILQEYPLTLIEGDTQINQIKEFADTKITQSGSWTDISVGLKRAVEMIGEGKNPQNKQAIIVVSDGENEFSGDRTAAKSYADLEYATTSGIPIHVIGISIDDSDVEKYLSDIGNDTSGSYHSASTGNDLDQIFAQIQEELLGLESDNQVFNVGPDGYTVDIEIPPNVFYANIQLDHTEPIETSLQHEKDGSIIYNKSDVILTEEVGYSNIRLVEPKEGKYFLHVQSQDEQPVSFHFVMNNEVTVDVTEPTGGISSKTDFDLTATLMKGSEQYTDIPLDSLTANVIFTNTDTSMTQMFTMTPSGSDYIGKIDLDEDGNYEYQVTVSGKTMKLESPKYMLDVGGVVPSASSSEESSSSGQLEDRDDTKEKKSIIPTILIILLIVLLLVGGFFLYKKVLSGAGKMQGSMTFRLMDNMYLQRWTTQPVGLGYYGKKVSLGRVINDARMGDSYPPELEYVTLQSVAKNMGISVRLTNNMNPDSAGLDEKTLTASTTYSLRLPDDSTLEIRYTP